MRGSFRVISLAKQNNNHSKIVIAVSITPDLFSSYKIGEHQLKNRLAAVPVFTGYALPDGRVSKYMLDHYQRLAASGVSLVVVANVAVSDDGLNSRHQLRLDNDKHIRGLSRLAQAIKNAGALACIQLNHAGRFALIDNPIMPSPILDHHLSYNVSSLKQFMESFPFEQRFGLTKKMMQMVKNWQRPLDYVRLQRVQTDFAQAARRASLAGYDMVELHGASGYLLNQFLSKFTNRLSQGYGGSLVERARFPLEVFRAVKAALPGNYPIGYRLLTREWVPEGIDLDEALRLSHLLENEGVAYLSVSAAIHNSFFETKVQKFIARPAYLKEDGRALRTGTKVPIVLAGLLTDPSIARKVLQEGAADIVGLGRPLRLDPSWVRKARHGVGIKACINCHYCYKRVILERGFSCIQWPTWQQEKTELEHRMLKRGQQYLWVISRPHDLKVLKSVLPNFIDAEREISDHILFLKNTEEENLFTEQDFLFLTWAREVWQRENVSRSKPKHKVILTKNALEIEVEKKILQGNFGGVFIVRHKDEPWQQRLLYRLRRKTIGFLGDHKKPQRILVAIDLSPFSLLVLRHVKSILIKKPQIELNFVHILQGPAIEANARWKRFVKIVGLENDFKLRLLPDKKEVSEVVLQEIKKGDFGTVVMGKRGLSGIKRWLMGSVSARVLDGLDNESLFIVD